MLAGLHADQRNAAMIAGISLILNPQTPHAADMKEILRLFMEQHPLNPKADDFTQQEATIVRVLTNRGIWADSRDCYTAPPRSRSRSSTPTCQTTTNQHLCRTKSADLVPSKRPKRLDKRCPHKVEHGFASSGECLCLAVWSGSFLPTESGG